MPRVRYQNPDRLPGAAHFSADEKLRGSLNTVRLVKSQKWVWDSLREACDLEVNYARHREPGHWELDAVAFVASRQVDIQPFWDESSDELWQECGFNGRPTYITTWRRLRELESVCDEFLSAAALIIQRCRKHDSRVMAHVHFDYTEDETHASLVHDCKRGDDCGYSKKEGKGGRVWGFAKRPERASVQAAREERHALSEEAPATAAKHEKASAPEKAEIKGGIKRVRINGCWYRMRDTEAGIRAYTGPRGSRRFWVGYYSGKAVDHFTGGIIPSVDSSSRQECHLFPELYDRVRVMVGQAPETAIADRGMSVASCFEHTTKDGTAAVFPWRKNGKDGQRHDYATHDRHGVKRCKHCGGDMEQIRFSANGGSPRLWFRCINPSTEACDGEQTISCATEPTAHKPGHSGSEARSLHPSSHRRRPRPHRLSGSRLQQPQPARLSAPDESPWALSRVRGRQRLINERRGGEAPAFQLKTGCLRRKHGRSRQNESSRQNCRQGTVFNYQLKPDAGCSGRRLYRCPTPNVHIVKPSQTCAT